MLLALITATIIGAFHTAVYLLATVGLFSWLWGAL